MLNINHSMACPWQVSRERFSIFFNVRCGELQITLPGAAQPIPPSPPGLRIFLAWPALRARGENAAGITAVLAPWPGQNPSATRLVLFFSQLLDDEMLDGVEFVEGHGLGKGFEQ